MRHTTPSGQNEPGVLARVRPVQRGFNIEPAAAETLDPTVSRLTPSRGDDRSSSRSSSTARERDRHRFTNTEHVGGSS
jgi:acetolactate synthase small subunit